MQCIMPLVILFSAGVEASPQPAEGVGAWPAERGSHRAVVQVDRPADAVWIDLPWRRRDAEPEKKAVLVFDAATGKQVDNATVVRATPACGDIVFQPATAPGKYYVYYLPTSQTGVGYFPEAAYDRIRETADAAWRSRVGLPAGPRKQETWRQRPQAQLVGFEAIDAYDKFTSMERIATPQEVGGLLAADPQAAFFLFPEDREHPIRMSDRLPQRWVNAGLRDCFAGNACRGEFYAFQIGVFAAARAGRREHRERGSSPAIGRCPPDPGVGDPLLQQRRNRPRPPALSEDGGGGQGEGRRALVRRPGPGRCGARPV